MIKQGRIKLVGVPRTFTGKEGNEMFSYPVTVAIPYVRQDGKPGEDELVCDHVCANPDYVQQLEGLAQQGTECDLTISFAVREYNGRKFNNVRLLNISKRISS